MRYIDTERVVIKSWCNEPEENALAQARNLANLPFAFRQVCLMPDTHEGYGMPIGGVIATRDAVIPNAVGVDIGCGMLAVRTSLEEIDQSALKRIVGSMRKTIPVGFDHHEEPQDESLMPQLDDPARYPEVSRQYRSACKQLGTLGGGNHFIEVQKGSDGHIWFMIHSGSRNLGLKVANRHNRIAVDLNERWHAAVPKKWELAFLPLESEEASTYLREMRYCLEFALANRQLMAGRVRDAFRDEIPAVTFADAINIHHNYASLENHFGENVLVHRKGATSARDGEMGIIPGSQGTASYIVRGKGNPDSFMSCSHGAGRRMGRQAAIRNLDLEAEKKALEEAAGAYKDIVVVMEEQRDLVDIIVRLEPLAVIKG